MDATDSLALAPADAAASNAQVPIQTDQRQTVAPFLFSGDEPARLRARDCLAVAGLYEAGEDPAAERAVMQVVLNRVRHPAFPKSVCSVVFQGAERPTGCQFTFTCDGALSRTPSDVALARARAIASAALAGQVDARVGQATHYHADYVVPRWRDALVKIAQEGRHLFYRWPGYWGTRGVLHMAAYDPEPFEPLIARLSPAHDPRIAADVVLIAGEGDHREGALSVPLVAPDERAGTMQKPRRDPHVHDMAISDADVPGALALRALDLCAHDADCTVWGWVDRSAEGTTAPSASAKPAFLYVRHAVNGAEGAYWNCDLFARSDPAQCMPQGARLTRLLVML